jgi:hypothetical protein
LKALSVVMPLAVFLLMQQAAYISVHHSYLTTFVSFDVLGEKTQVTWHRHTWGRLIQFSFSFSE